MFVFSEYDIRMFLFVCRLRNRPYMKYLCNCGNGGEGRPKCVQVRTVGEGYQASCARKHLHYLFMFLSYSVLLNL